MKKRSVFLVFVIIFLLMTTIVFAAKPVKDPVIEVNEKYIYEASVGGEQLVIVFDLKQGDSSLLVIEPSSGSVRDIPNKKNNVITTYELYYTWDVTVGENPVTIDFIYGGKSINQEMIDIVNNNQPRNTPPVFEASNYNLVVDEDQQSQGISIVATDADGDSLGYTHTNGIHGVVEYLNGLYYYTPDVNFNGSDSFTVTVTDGTETVSTVVSVTIHPVNDTPVAVDDTATTKVGETIQIDLLANDSDVDGDPLTASINGTVLSDGIYTYTAVSEGYDEIQYTLSDGTLTDTAFVKITVEDNVVNTPPVFDSTNYSLVVNEDERSQGITVSATDADGDPLNYTHTNGTHGVVEYLNSLYYYTPDVNFNGSDSFTVTVTDGTDSVASVVSVTVTPVNDAPVAVDDSATTKVGETIQIDLLANDSDVDGDPLTASIDGTELTNGIYTYTAVSEGYFEIEYTLSDGSLTDTAYVKITVESNALVYVALGDSIPEGTYYRSLWDYMFGGTDAYSYIEQLRDTLGISSADYFDESVSGFNAYEVYDQIANTSGSTAEYIRNADFITLAVGANDIMDAVSRSMSGLDKYDINWSVATDGLNSFEYYWPRIIDQIESLNPDATIIVMTVYNPYHESEAIYAQVNSYFTNDGTIDFDNDGLMDLGLNDIINGTNTTLDYRVADVYSAFNNHANKDSLTGFYNSFCDPHPNQNGQDLIFDLHYSLY